MIHVGLTGGLASGKSFVGRSLADLGCFLIQADELGHQVIEPGGEAY
jgi:dephospho-CoA kinase